MATTMGEITKDGEFKIRGNINTRIPAITDGLVAHFPFDGRGGAFDSIKGNQTIQNVETGVNLIEAMQLDWRDPNSWSSTSGVVWDEGKQALKITGYSNNWLKTPIIVDPTKHYQISIDVLEEVQSSSGLYLGGYATNAAGQRVTSNYDYSYAVNAQPNTGEWTTYRVTRYGTGVISYNNSQTFDTIVGWTGDSSGVTDKLTKFYYFGGLFNYNSGGVMYIKNPSIVIAEPDTSNTNVTDEGVAIEVATTNLWSGNLGTYNNYGVPSSLTLLNETFRGQPVYRLAMTVDAAHSSSLTDFKSNLWSHGVVGSSRTYLANTKYVDSIYWRVVNKPDVVVGGTASNIGGWTSSGNTDIDGSWKRYVVYRDGTVTSDKTDNVFFSFYCPSLALNETIYIDWCCPQIEQGITYATSYVLGSRGAGRLGLLPSIFPQASGTIVCRARLNGSTAGKIFSNEVSSGGNAIILNPDNTATFVTQSSKVVSVSNIKNYHHYAYRVNSDATVSCFVDGVNQGLVGTTIYTARTSFQLGEDTNNTYISSVYIKDFSIYNRALSDAEIGQLAKPTLELTSTGNVNVTGIRSIPSMPSDVYYFPLETDAKGAHGAYSPTTESNITYQNGCAWVGKAITNLYRQATYDNDFSGMGSGRVTVHTSYEGTPEFWYDYTQNLTWTYHGQSMTITSGTKYIACMDVFISSDANISSTGTTFVANLEGGLSDSFSYDNTKKGQWQHLEKVVTSTTTSANLYIYPSTSTIPATTGIVKYKNIMVVAAEYHMPFANGGRGAGVLKYSPNAMIGLDLNNSDWTVGCFIKPIPSLVAVTGVRQNPLEVGNYYVDGNTSLSVFHENQANDFSGIIYDGKTGRTSPSQLNLNSTDMGKWLFICLRMSGTTLSMSAVGCSSGLKTKTCTKTWTNPIGDTICVGGYAWAPGDYYVRDLIIAKRALTDIEVENIYKNKMECLDEGILRIQNSVTTGVVLT